MPVHPKGRLSSNNINLGNVLIELSMIIRWFKPNDLIGIKKIIKELHPQWFYKKALKNIPRDVKQHQCIVAENRGKIIGFITFYSQKSEGYRQKNQRKAWT